jgi:hypothetical protein
MHILKKAQQQGAGFLRPALELGPQEFESGSH